MLPPASARASPDSTRFRASGKRSPKGKSERRTTGPKPPSSDANEHDRAMTPKNIRDKGRYRSRSPNLDGPQSATTVRRKPTPADRSRLLDARKGRSSRRTRRVRTTDGRGDHPNVQLDPPDRSHSASACPPSGSPRPQAAVSRRDAVDFERGARSLRYFPCRSVSVRPCDWGGQLRR